MLFVYFFIVIMGFAAQVIMPIAAAGSDSGSSPIGPGAAGPNDTFWLETISHQVCRAVRITNLWP